MCESDQAQSMRIDKAQGMLQLVVPDAVFARRATRVGLAIVTVTKARIDPEPYRMSAGNLAQLNQHVGRAAVHRYSQLCDPRQRRLVDYVGGEHDLMRSGARNIACPQGTLDFAERDGIHEDAHLAQHTEHVNVAVCLLCKPNAVERLQLPDALAHRLGLIQPKGRTDASCGLLHGIDQGRCQGIRSGHAGLTSISVSEPRRRRAALCSCGMTRPEVTERPFYPIRIARSSPPGYRYAAPPSLPPWRRTAGLSGGLLASAAFRQTNPVSRSTNLGRFGKTHSHSGVLGGRPPAVSSYP